ncbi:MAG: glycosyltransferase [Ginsengibacter sp.]
MNSSTMVSVLLLSWNHEKYIEQSVRSVIGQTYRDIEIIYADNNSSDNTFIIAQNILKDSGLKYKAFKREKNFTISQNLNFLFSKSSGEFLCVLSADDWLHPMNIEKKLNPFAKNDLVGLVYSNGFIYYDDINIYEPEIATMSGADLVQELLQRNFILGTGCVIRREAILSAGLWDEDLLIEDWDMWIRISMNSTIETVDAFLFYYRKHAAAISENAEFMYKAKKHVLDKYKEINNNCDQSDRNIWETNISQIVRGYSSIGLTLQIFKRAKPNVFYVKLILKSLIPFFLKRKYFIRSLKKKYAKNGAPDLL